MAQTIGLRAVIDLSNFNRGLSSYNSGIGKMNSTTANFVSKAGKDFVGLGQSVLKFGTIAGGAALAGVTALGAGLASFAIGGIKQAKDLDQQMADIASVMGKTKDAVTPLKEEILALSIDPQLRVNATEAATAIELLARNGLEMTQILDGAAKSTVALANATRADFGTAADVATDVMAIFNIEAKNMGVAIDGITGVTTHSKLTIDDYALALASAGAVGQGMGLTLQDMNTVLAATASSFSSGRVAGTSLKVLLQRLANPTAEMTAEMERYGISLFDSEGNMRSMADIAGQLNSVFQGTATITQTVGGATKEQAALAKRASQDMDSLKASIAANQDQLQLYNDQLALEIGYYGAGSPKVRQRQIQIDKLNNTINKQNKQLSDYEAALVAVSGVNEKVVTSTKTLTEAEKAQLAAVLGGADGARQIIALSKLTADEFDNLSDSVNAEGQAMRAAATRVDSLQGAIDILKSIIQSVQIQVGDKFLPILKQMTVGFSDLAAKYGPAVVAFFGRIADTVGNAIGMFRELANTLISAFQTGGTAGLVDALGLTPQTTELIAKIANSIMQLGNAIVSFFLPGLQQISGGGILDAINTAIIFLNQNFEAFKGAIMGVGAVLAGAAIAAILSGIVTAIGAILSPIGLLIIAAGALGAAWATNWGGIREKTATAVSFVMNVLMALVNTFQGQVWPPLQAAFQNITDAMNKLGIDWGDVWNALVTATGIVIGAIIVTITGLVTGIATAFEVATRFIDDFGMAFKTIIEGIALTFSGWVTLIQGIMSGDWAQIWQGASQILEGTLQIWLGIFQTIATAIEAGFSTALAFVLGFAQGVINVFTNLSNTLVGNSIIPDMVQRIITVFQSMIQPILDIFSRLSEGISTVFSTLFGGGGGGGFSLDISAFTDALPRAIEAAAAVMGTLSEAISLVNEQIATILPGSVIIFTEIFFTSFTRIIEILTQVDILLIKIALTTLVMLQNAARMTAQIIVAAFQEVNAILMTTDILLLKLASSLAQIAAAAKSAAKAMKDGFSEGAKTIKDKLIPAIDYAIKKLEALRIKASQAMVAVSSIGQIRQGLGATASGGMGIQRGMGFQGGTPSNTGNMFGLGYRIPPGFANDTFGPLFVSSGEEALVAPRSTSIESLILSRLAQLLGQSRVAGAGVGSMSQVNIGPIYINNDTDVETFVQRVKRVVTGRPL